MILPNLCNGFFQLDRVPEDDGGDDQVKAGGSVALIFK
jgi:hypothetical protein